LRSINQDELDVVLDHRVGLVRLAEKAAAVAAAREGRVGDLVPDDRRQIGEADPPAALLDRRMQRHHLMHAEVAAPRQANIADHADQPPARDQRVEAVPPDLVELVEESLIAPDVAELTFRVVVLLGRPVRRRGEHQIDARRREEVHLPRITIAQVMPRRHLLRRVFDLACQGRVLGDRRDQLLRDRALDQLFGQQPGEVGG